MFKDNEIKITDEQLYAMGRSFGKTALVSQIVEGVITGKLKREQTDKHEFTETFTKEKLIKLMGWNEVPKLAKKNYTYDMRKILGQLTPNELKNLAKREAKELQVKRGKAKMRKLLARAI